MSKYIMMFIVGSIPCATVLAILAVTVFIILMAFIEAYVLSEISALLGLLLILPLVFIGAVIMCTWFDLMCEWGF
jgi:hypothetical protein